VSQEAVEVYSQDAEAGKWYDHSIWGKMLCCGTTGGDWINAFAVRTNTGRTVLKYVDNKRIKESESQSW